MIRLALTGSIGMGKSTVSKMFEAAEIPVFDADAIVRRLQGPGGELVEAIEQHFPGTTGPNGTACPEPSSTHPPRPAGPVPPWAPWARAAPRPRPRGSRPS